MSGHSKWHSIRFKKGIADAKRGKIFTKHAKLITIAAREGGGDPEMNPALRTAIDTAKRDNMPNANIDRAIKRGTGELKEGAEIVEVMYEGYGPEGIAVYIQALTDNRNRTVANIKNILAKNGGSMGDAGSVAWMFGKRGFILVNCSGDVNMEEVELAAIDSGAQDLKRTDHSVEVYTSPEMLMHVKKDLESAGFKVEAATITFVPKNEITVDDEIKARKILKFMEVLEDEEDVTNVYSNFDIDEELMEKIGV